MKNSRKAIAKAYKRTATGFHSSDVFADTAWFPT